MGNEGDNRNLGVYYSKVPATGPDTDSIEVRLEPQGLNVTPNLRLRHTRMIYQVPGTNNTALGVVDITFNSPINWADDSLHTLLLDNTRGTIPAIFKFSLDYTFKDNNLGNSKSVQVAIGERAYFYMSIISGKIYVNTALNSDPINFV